jgi:hypothetical protein
MLQVPVTTICCPSKTVSSSVACPSAAVAKFVVSAAGDALTVALAAVGYNSVGSREGWRREREAQANRTKRWRGTFE